LLQQDKRDFNKNMRPLEQYTDQECR